MKIKIFTVQTIGLAVGIFALSIAIEPAKSLESKLNRAACHHPCKDQETGGWYCCPHKVPTVPVFSRYMEPLRESH